MKSQEDTRRGQASRRRVRPAAIRPGERAAGRGHRQPGRTWTRRKSALDAAQAELQSLEAQVREQQVQLRYHRVAAPTSGIVGDIPVRVGDRVTELHHAHHGGPARAASRPTSTCPSSAPRVSAWGCPCGSSTAPGPSWRESQVGFISPRVDDQTQTVLVKAAIPNEEGTLRHRAVHPRAHRLGRRTRARWCPSSPCRASAGAHFAFVAVDEKGVLVARQRPMRVGEIVGNDYVVLEGIEPGRPGGGLRHAVPGGRRARRAPGLGRPMFVDFFIRRPIFATVCALLITSPGSVAIPTLPIAQFPNLAPPQVVVTSAYIGASAQAVETAVTTPARAADQRRRGDEVPDLQQRQRRHQP